MRIIVIIFAVAVLSLTSFAQQTPPAPSKEKPATQQLPADAAGKDQLMQLFEVLGISKQMQGVVSSMASSMEQLMPTTNLSEKQKGEVAKLEAELFDKTMSPEFIHSYLEEMVPVYQRHFTKADVDQIITFYSSPAGQKFVNEQPVIMQEILPKIVPMMQKHMQDTMNETNFEERMRQIYAEHSATPEKN